jgi:hypothetical protein
MNEKSLVFKLGKDVFMDDLRVTSQKGVTYPEEKYLGEITYIGKKFIQTSFGYTIRVD